ncbi:FAD-binding oxidoreductase [Nocardia sp. CDC159]|uniref:FAD-binding oxidoreductase n=1 Tax=Nocardia pulmonis TaxID=2951408 RepID=A0A9X2EE80_9NOCA|nr:MULTISPECIES: FAD-binding oxidoreductase [Nocardia]MCM6778715.1 FAD-binding oxidoreductase [Nocardia pulmonis]MCM6791604.1 FAD-binding oxidoreductase [Nocardia sp. CDC159]
MSAGQGGWSRRFELSRRHLFAIGGGLAVAACSPVGGAERAEPADDSGLRSAVRGRVLLPGDAGFDRARTPWNLTVDQSVRAVVEPADADDAVALVRYARDTGRDLAVQPNGHNPSAAVNGTILVRTRALNELRIDPATRSARVGAGVSWGQVQAAASGHGLTGVAGSSPAVGVTGYTLGGGLSWFARRFGWASDSVTAFDIVDADATARRVTKTSDPELFWALRGGGGDHALITATEFDLHPAPALYGGKMVWPVALAARVLAAFREITASAPDELTLWWSLLRVPDAPPMVAVDLTYLGEAGAAETLLRPLDRIEGRLRDTRRSMPPAELGTIVGEPTDPSPISSHIELLTALTDADAVNLLAEPMDPLVGVQVRHLGGALARPSDSAAGAVTAPYYLGLIAVQPAPAAAAANEDRVAKFLGALEQSRSRRTPRTLLGPRQTAADAFGSDTLNRLRDIKRRSDPKDLFRSNFPVLNGTAGR